MLDGLQDRGGGEVTRGHGGSGLKAQAVVAYDTH